MNPRGGVPPVSQAIRLSLTDDEALDVHSALGVVVELLDQVTPGPGALLTKASRAGLVLVARRLDHERRHKGRVPNPNGPLGADSEDLPHDADGEA